MLTYIISFNASLIITERGIKNNIPIGGGSFPFYKIGKNPKISEMKKQMIKF